MAATVLIQAEDDSSLSGEKGSGDGTEERYPGGTLVGGKEISETKRRRSWENEVSLVGTERVNR